MMPQSSKPDWQTQTEDILCPLCDYNLRGIEEPRCPECGYRFQWPELLDPARRAHPYLFEHRVHDNVMSFLRTLSGGLRPWRFWSSLHPAQPSDPRRLLIYFIITWLPILIAVIGLYVAAVGASRQEAARMRAQWVMQVQRNPQQFAPFVRGYASAQAYADKNFPSTWTLKYFYGSFVIYQQWLVPLLPAIFMAALMIFQMSMHQARVKRIHVWRCLVYGLDHAFYIGIAALAVSIWTLSSSGSGEVYGYLALSKSGVWQIARMWPVVYVLHWGMLLLIAVALVRLSAAYRNYLRFRHPTSTIASVCLIVLLFIWAIIATT